MSEEKTTRNAEIQESDYSDANIITAKLVNEIFSNNFTIGKKDSIVVIPRIKKTEKNSKYTTKESPSFDLRIIYAINPETENYVEFTYFDKIVFDSIYTIYCKKNTFTLRELLHEIYGYEIQLSQTKRDELKQSIKKLSDTKIILDCRNEYRFKKLTKKGGVYYNSLLETDNPNFEKKRFKILNPSPLFEYAEKVGQISNIPVGLLRCNRLKGSDKTLSNTEELIKIKRYLISRIEALRNTRNHINKDVIVYYRKDSKKKNKCAGLLPTINVDLDEYETTTSRKNKIKSINKTVTAILDYYAEINYIYGYEITGEGKDTKITLIKDKKTKQYANNPWKCFID